MIFGSKRDPAFEIRFNDERAGEIGRRYLAKEIEGRGPFPIAHPVRLGFITSVFDRSAGEPEPVLSAIEQFQEPGNVVFQHLVEGGWASPGQGFGNWTRLGVVIPEILQAPHGGHRDLVAVLRMVNLDNPPVITHGFDATNQNGVLWLDRLEFSHIFDDKGYKELAENRDEALGLAVKIGIAVAMSDGALDGREEMIVRKRIVREIKPFPEEKQRELIDIYRSAMKDAYRDAKRDRLRLDGLTRRLNEIGEKKAKYDAVELCFDVMAADGVADAEEMKIIRAVAEALELDLDEIEKMRDQKIIGLDSEASGQADAEELLGIEPEWTIDRIKKHLRSEFQKWNNRLTTLDEGGERENAQRMLDLIAEARKKYA